MAFFIAMFICNLLIPLIMLIGGYCMYKNPPKEINGLVGYRTTMSKKNKDTWSLHMNIETIQLVVLIGSIVSVEKALKRTFDENGIRR